MRISRVSPQSSIKNVLLCYALTLSAPDLLGVCDIVYTLGNQMLTSTERLLVRAYPGMPAFDLGW